jgi:hypothetical protein
MDILTLMTNNNCDILRKSASPDYRVPPINLDDLPKFLLGKLRLLLFMSLPRKKSPDRLSPTANKNYHYRYTFSLALAHYQINNTLSSFSSFTATIPKCGGCHEFILDRFILKVSDRTWHAKCLQCNDCHAQLNEKCFIRNGQLFCKDDFFK